MYNKSNQSQNQLCREKIYRKEPSIKCLFSWSTRSLFRAFINSIDKPANYRREFSPPNHRRSALRSHQLASSSDSPLCPPRTFFSDGLEFAKAKLFHRADESAATQLRGLSGIAGFHVRAGVCREVTRGRSAATLSGRCSNATTSDHTQHLRSTTDAQYAW
jgi:hypothetical protein